tara:strand:- start:19382 stop:19606 length:225 start_codon:yes stop_codon:yes gene_type:complete
LAALAAIQSPNLSLREAICPFDVEDGFLVMLSTPCVVYPHSEMLFCILRGDTIARRVWELFAVPTTTNGSVSSL